MDQKDINCGALRDFVETHSLRDNHSVIQFNAIVDIETEQNDSIENLKVGITFDGYNNYGRVDLLDGDLDENLFPTYFDAKWGTFEHDGGIFLRIQGTHPWTQIGKYTAKITPKGRLRD